MAGTNKSSTELAMLDEPVAGRLNIQYAPHADTEIAENPPRFSWLPVIEAEALYAVRITFSPLTKLYQRANINGAIAFVTSKAAHKQHGASFELSAWVRT